MATNRYSLSLATPYVSAYNPADTQRFSNLMQQEYEKGMQAKAAINEFESALGSIPTQDIEGRKQRISEFDQQINKIQELYNDDIALAASDLAGAIVKERQNPWYQKNRKYMQESQRRQQLLDKYGPNILFLKDLPQGNLNEMSIEDIGFDYLNRQHLFDMYQKQFGDLAKKTTPLGLRPDKYGMLRYGVRQGLTPDERAQLFEEAQSGYLPGLLKDLEFENNPQAANIVANELRGWIEGNLTDSTKYSYLRNPTVGTSSLGNISDGSLLPGSVPSNRTPYNLNQSGQDLLTALTSTDIPEDQKKETISNSQNILDEEQAQILQNSLDKQFKITDPELNNLPGFRELEPNLKQEVVTELNSRIQDHAMRSKAGKNIRSIPAIVGDVFSKYNVIDTRSIINPHKIKDAIFPNLDTEFGSGATNRWEDYNWDKDSRWDTDPKLSDPIKNKIDNYINHIEQQYKPVAKDIEKKLENTASQQILVGRGDYQNDLDMLMGNVLKPQNATETLVYYNDEGQKIVGNDRYDNRRRKKNVEKLNQILNTGNYQTAVYKGEGNMETKFEITGKTDPKDKETTSVVFNFGDTERNINTIREVATTLEDPSIFEGAMDNLYTQNFSKQGKQKITPTEIIPGLDPIYDQKLPSIIKQDGYYMFEERPDMKFETLAEAIETMKTQIIPGYENLYQRMYNRIAANLNTPKDRQKLNLMLSKYSNLIQE